MLPRITLLLTIPIFGYLVPRADCASGAFPSRESSQAIQVSIGADTNRTHLHSTRRDCSFAVPTARIPLPVLTLTSISNTRTGFLARLRCLPATNCVPFFVLLQPDKQIREIILQSETRRAATRPRSDSGWQPREIDVKTRRRRTSGCPSATSSGRIGTWIRVSEKSRAKYTWAYVTGAGAVEASY